MYTKLYTSEKNLKYFILMHLQ